MVTTSQEYQSIIISIHALRKESDHSSSHHLAQRHDFNPRSP